MLAYMHAWVIKIYIYQGHPMDRCGGMSVQKTCNHLRFSVREMSSRAFLILMPFIFGEIKMTFWAQK